MLNFEVICILIKPSWRVEPLHRGQAILGFADLKVTFFESIPSCVLIKSNHSLWNKENGECQNTSARQSRSLILRGSSVSKQPMKVVEAEGENKCYNVSWVLVPLMYQGKHARLRGMICLVVNVNKRVKISL